MSRPEQRPADGLALVPLAKRSPTAAEFASGQDVRWCPGCGDFGVLAAFKQFLPTLGIRRENVVFISGIGCSSRFPYYLDTYGMHSIHGRAPTIATGLATTRPDLSIWVITGDGDGLSIGGNHLIHALRRNVNVKIILFNNRVYGLTKGQFSPTSPPGTVTKSSPSGSVDRAFNPVSLALGAEATFVARAVDVDRPGLMAVLTAAARHRGAALVEILQDCPVFNPGAMQALHSPEGHARHVLPLTHDAPLRFGPPGPDGQGTRVVVRDGFGVRITTSDEVRPTDILRHDETDLGLAFAISRLIGPGPDPTPLGVLRRIGRETYDDAARRVRPQPASPGSMDRADELQRVLDGEESWEITDEGDAGVDAFAWPGYSP